MRILFVCLGNICRSPMAKMIMNDIMHKNNVTNVYVDSCGTSDEESGNPIYPYAEDVLIKHDIKIENHTARQFKLSDYDNFDLIICMEDYNINCLLRIIGTDRLNKIHKLSEYTKNNHDINDPWYTRDFESAYNDIYDGCISLYERIKGDIND